MENHKETWMLVSSVFNQPGYTFKLLDTAQCIFHVNTVTIAKYFDVNTVTIAKS